MENNMLVSNDSVEKIESVPDKPDVAHLSDVKPGDGNEVLETRFAELGRWKAAKVFRKAIMFCLILHWAALVDGFQQQIPGNVLPMVPFVRDMADTTINGQPALSAQVISYLQGFAEMAKMFGYGLGGWLSDRFGRRTTMWISIILLLAGATGEILSQKWQDWLGSTCIIRFSVGLATSTLVTYISELSPHQIRGLMVGAYQLWLAVGQLISAIAAKIMTDVNPNQWRPLIATEFLFTGLLFIFMIFVPESPQYYARKEQHEKAKKTMKKLYGEVEGYDVDFEYKVLLHGIEAERALSHSGDGATLYDIFKGNNWKRTLAGSVGILTQPLGGSPIIFTYSTFFFQTAGFENPFLVTVITFIVLIIGITMGLFLCEHVGRRPLLIGGSTAMMLFNVGLATTGFFDTPATGRASLAMLILWVLSYGLSAGPLGFVASGEVSTPRLRAISTGFNLFLYGIAFVVFQWTIPYMISPDSANLGVKAIYVWAGFLLPIIILLWFFYPETFGRTYIEIDELYERKIPAWRFKETETHCEEANRKRKPIL